MQTFAHLWALIFIRKLCNLPETLNSDNLLPDFCNKEYFKQLVGNNTTVLDFDSRIFYTKRHITSNSWHLPSTKDSNPAENFAFSHEYYSNCFVSWLLLTPYLRAVLYAYSSLITV